MFGDFIKCPSYLFYLGKQTTEKKNKKRRKEPYLSPTGEGPLTWPAQPTRGPPLSSSSPGPDAARWRACAGHVATSCSPLLFSFALETPGKLPVPFPPLPVHPSPSLAVFRATPRAHRSGHRAPAWPPAPFRRTEMSRSFSALDSV